MTEYHGTIIAVKETFGFIQPHGTEHKDVFFHASALEGLEFGETLIERRVKFTMRDSDRGPRAIKVEAAE